MYGVSLGQFVDYVFTMFLQLFWEPSKITQHILFDNFTKFVFVGPVGGHSHHGVK